MARKNNNKVARREKRKSGARATAEETLNSQAKEAPLKFELRTNTQEIAWDALSNHDITFLLGAAGSGKTFLAMAYAIQAVLNKQCSNIILTRPIVEAGEKLGFLPGTFDAKVNPYMAPLYDTMDMLLGKYSARREVINKAVVLAPLSYMRGRTFNDAICVFDEAQNATYPQLKLFLSRFGKNSKVIVTGDPYQSDLNISPPPLTDVIRRIQDIPSINVTHFKNADIIRHPTVAAILDRL